MVKAEKGDTVAARLVIERAGRARADPVVDTRRWRSVGTRGSSKFERRCL
jgi:hypothetical protein